MSSDSIVKIEACDGAVEDEPEVDPFMDISSLRTRVKVEVLHFERALTHSSVDLKPELPIPPGQNEEEFHPGEFLQVKMEESEEAIKPEISESSDEDETENSSSEDEAPTGKYEGVFFNDVMEEFIKKYQPTETLLIILKNEPCLRYLPHFGSVRCEPCYLGIGKSIWKIKGSQTSFSSKKGHKFPERIHRSVTEIKQHISTTRHLHFTVDSNNQPYPKESTDFNETGLFINDSILELLKSKFTARSRLFQILQSDMNGNKCLVYLSKLESIRCEFCYQNNIEARSPKYDFKRGLKVKRGLLIPENANNDSSFLARCIVDHFISDEHSAVVNQRKYFGEQKAHKRPKLSRPDGAKAGNSSSTLSIPSKSSLDGSAPTLPIKSTSSANKTNVPTPSDDGSSPLDPNMIRRMGIKSKGLIKLLMDDWEGDRCLRFVPNGSNPKNGAIRCETCYRDPYVIGCSRRLRRGIPSKMGIFYSKPYILTHNVKVHISGARHLECVKARNAGTQVDSGSVAAESSNSIISNGVKIEEKDSIRSGDIEFEALDIKQEFQDLIPKDVKKE